MNRPTLDDVVTCLALVAMIAFFLAAQLFIN